MLLISKTHIKYFLKSYRDIILNKKYNNIQTSIFYYFKRFMILLIKLFGYFHLPGEI